MTRKEAEEFLFRLIAQHAAERAASTGPVRIDLATQAHTALYLLGDIPDWAIERAFSFHVSVVDSGEEFGIRFPHIRFAWMRGFRFNPGNAETFINMNGDAGFAVSSSFLAEVVSVPPPPPGQFARCGLAIGPSAKEQVDKILALQVDHTQPPDAGDSST